MNYPELYITETADVKYREDGCIIVQPFSEELKEYLQTNGFENYIGELYTKYDDLNHIVYRNLIQKIESIGGKK